MVCRSGYRLVVCAATVLALCLRYAAGTSGRGVGIHAQETTPLVPGAVIERDLAAAQSHTYQVTLAAGDFVSVTIEQRGIDVAATIVRPDGRDAIAVNACDEDFRPETILAIADVSGVHTIAVRPAPSTRSGGRYAIHLDERRPARPPDRVRVEAERAFERGRALFVTRQPAGYRSALAEFQNALDRYRQIEDRRGELKAAIDFAGALTRLSMPEALASALFAEAHAREVRDEPARARALRVLGDAYHRAGDFPAALRAYEESVVISRTIGDRRGEASSLNNAGVIAGQTGDGEQAVAKFERALQLDRAAGRGDDASSELNNLGVAYKNLGRFDKSLEAYEQSVTLARARQDRHAEARILNNMGNVQRLLGHHDKALALHTTALAISREIGGKEEEARSLNTIGLTYYALSQYAKALDYHREALAMRRQLADQAGQASSLNGAGLALHRLRDSEKALEALREALAIRRGIHEEYGESDSLRDIAAVERDAGSLLDAMRDAEAAVNLDEGLRARITSPELRATYVAAEHNKYELLIDVLQALHAADAGGNYDQAAFQVSERARARVLLDSMLDARVDLREGIDPELLQRERSLQRQLSDTSAKVSGSLTRAARGTDSSSAAQELERLTEEYQHLQATVRRQSPRYAAVTQPRPLDAPDIQRSVLDDDTVLLEFALGDERSWLWAVTRESLTSVELPPRATIESAARSLYELFTARQKRRGESGTQYAARVAAADRHLPVQARAVSRLLLGGTARQLHEAWRNKRLAIVAAGSLEYLPFAALPVPAWQADAEVPRTVSPRGRPPDVPLAAEHEIVQLPSASVLAVIRSETASRPPAPGAVAILADPVFDTTDPRVTAARRRGTVPAGHDTASRADDFMDAADARAGFARLPFSREEANAIASLVGDGRALKALDFKASRATALGDGLRGYRIVHLATHGVVNSERPALSALILSLVDERGSRQNGYLRLPDVYNMRLDADLVVLSACQTALGKEMKGEGLVGLTRAFLYAGAPRVVASLWEVDDLATAELMKKFYTGMLQHHLRPAAALRAAQIELSKDPRRASPYFWAGFVLHGEWQ